MKKQLESRADIELLVDSFYKKVIDNAIIGRFFTEVVKLDWDKHIPIMYNFWETTLLGKISYRGNPMIKHIQLNTKAPLEKHHFDEWLRLWHQTIDDLFVGKKAEEAKQRATQIAALMQHKIRQAQ